MSLGNILCDIEVRQGSSNENRILTLQKSFNQERNAFPAIIDQIEGILSEETVEKPEESLREAWSDMNQD